MESGRPADSSKQNTDDNNSDSSKQIRSSVFFLRGVIGPEDDEDDNDTKPVWPTWVVGALFRGAKRIHINRICFHIPPSYEVNASMSSRSQSSSASQ